MKNSRKKIVAAAAALVVLAAVMLAVWFGTRPAAGGGEKTIAVSVVHSDGTEKEFTYDTDAGYVGEVLLSEGLIAGEDSEYGLYVLTVDGEDAVYETDGAYWAFYENGEYASQGVDQTPAEDGGSYGFVYTVG